MLLIVTIVLLAGCSDTTSTSEGSRDQSQIDSAAGKQLYQANCASCHGSDLRGTDKGPSHLSKVYEPGHHSDDGFRFAIKNGARQHHWNFGDMPAIPGLSDDEIDSIIAYVRAQQQEQGLE